MVSPIPLDPHHFTESHTSSNPTTRSLAPLVIVPRCQPGDIWQLGEKHIVACVDSLLERNVLNLVHERRIHCVFADAPYGINILKKRGRIGRGGKLYDPVLGDESIETAVRSYRLCSRLFPEALLLFWGANYYAHALPPSPCWIVWDKACRWLSFADAELAWTNSKQRVRVFRHAWSGARRESEKNESRWGPCQKPIALATWCFEKFTQEGSCILDPFLGTGISILAAEHMNRSVIGIDLVPKYCDISIARWEAMTGKQAVLLKREPLLAEQRESSEILLSVAC
jgi:hypothetical protein